MRRSRPGFEARNLVHDARLVHRSASGLVMAQGQVLAVSVAAAALDQPVGLAGAGGDPGPRRRDPLGNRGARRRDGRHLRRPPPARRRHDGSRGARRISASGRSSRRSNLAAPGVGVYGAVAVAALPLAGGFRVLAGTATPTPTHGALPLPGAVLAILAIGLLLAIGTFFLLARRAAEDDPFIEMTTAAAVSVIGRYTLVERIGLGGMAEIYAAVTTGEGSFRRPVVIKRLRPELTADPNAVAQFCDEANLLAALHHPNIVAVYDFGRWQSQFYLAEEYVQGRDLGRIISKTFARDGRPPPPEVVAFVAHEILKGLDYAHGMQNERGRPMGIVSSRRFTRKRGGLAARRGQAARLRRGQDHRGTGGQDRDGGGQGERHLHVSEQARGLDVDGRADLFSLALVMYFCCTGNPALRRSHDLWPPTHKRAPGRGSTGAPPSSGSPTRSERWSGAPPIPTSRCATPAPGKWRRIWRLRRGTARRGPPPWSPSSTGTS